MFTGADVWTPMSPSAAAALTPTQLQTNAFFSLYGNDVALLGSGGSAYAQTWSNRLLADSIPAMSLNAGANPIPAFQATGKNVDMMTLENGWSAGRGSEANKWHHSDFQQMAYTFTYKLFNQFVTTGNLK
jgi:hypothetical protein